MSTESSKSLKRQWHIVWYLLNGVYVSTTNIRDHLATLGIEAELRTIQRDLVLLENIFPLECRRESIPHSWRWRRPAETQASGLSLTQALTVRLVEDQLHDVMSPKMLQELQPLFVKARLVTGVGGKEGGMLAGLVGKAAVESIIRGAAAGGAKNAWAVPGFWSVLSRSLHPFQEKPEGGMEEALREMERFLRDEGLEENYLEVIFR